MGENEDTIPCVQLLSSTDELVSCALWLLRESAAKTSQPEQNHGQIFGDIGMTALPVTAMVAGAAVASLASNPTDTQSGNLCPVDLLQAQSCSGVGEESQVAWNVVSRAAKFYRSLGTRVYTKRDANGRFVAVAAVQSQQGISYPWSNPHEQHGKEAVLDILQRACADLKWQSGWPSTGMLIMAGVAEWLQNSVQNWVHEAFSGKTHMVTHSVSNIFVGGREQTAPCSLGDQYSQVHSFPPHFVSAVNKHWPYSSEVEPDYVTRLSQGLPCVGAVLKQQVSDETANCWEPTSWVLMQDYGALGMLHTMPDHRGKGLAKYVVTECIRRIETYWMAVIHELERETVASGRQSQTASHPPAFAHILVSNDASRRMFTRLGFRQGPRADWFVYERRQ